MARHPVLIVQARPGYPDKWLAAVSQQVQGELDRVSQALTSRIKELGERYATPIPQLSAEVEDGVRLETALMGWFY